MFQYSLKKVMFAFLLLSYSAHGMPVIATEGSGSHKVHNDECLEEHYLVAQEKALDQARHKAEVVCQEFVTQVGTAKFQESCQPSIFHDVNYAVVKASARYICGNL